MIGSVDYVFCPVNDDDIEGIYHYLAWQLSKAGLGSNCFHYLEILKKKAENNLPKQKNKVTYIIVNGTTKETFIENDDSLRKQKIEQLIKKYINHNYTDFNKLKIVPITIITE